MTYANEMRCCSILLIASKAFIYDSMKSRGTTHLIPPWKNRNINLEYIYAESWMNVHEISKLPLLSYIYQTHKKVQIKEHI